MLNLDVMKTASGLASFAYRRQSVIADNIANADTPGFKAKDLERSSVFTDSSLKLRNTNPKHFDAGQSAAEVTVINTPSLSSESPNGNNVSLEQQMMSGADVQHQHELALGVYQKSMAILRLSLGRG